MNKRIVKLARDIVAQQDRTATLHGELLEEINGAIERGEFSANALARKMQVSAAFVCDVRRGRRKLGVETLRVLAGGRE